MSARPLASATISFGLVSVPVKLFSTSESSTRVSFNMLNKDTGNRVKQQYIDPASGTVVPRADMVKGYEFAKGQYVVFEPDELKAIEAQSDNAIMITEFVPAEEIERIYFSKGYFLGPDKGGTRAYRLLSAALRDTGRAAIAKYAARGKQYLVMIRPMEDGLIMEQLHYPAEVRSFDEVPLEDGEVEDAELALAKQLIGHASVDEFDASKYHDEVHERVMELIQKKVDGEQITIAHEEQPETKIIDLMEALKASLGEGAGKKAGRKPPKQSTKKSAATKSTAKKVSNG
jgi:DNA end-binding protein Ku